MVAPPCRLKESSVNIYIDESGTFVSTPERESWSVVVALASAESTRHAIDDAVNFVRRSAGAPPNEEVKLNSISEANYLRFLNALDSDGLVVFATATDAGLNTPDRIERHKALQVEKFRANIHRMKHEGGRAALELLAKQIEALSHQLYVQLICQVHLMQDIVGRSINYFAQRRPATLREFRWRIDQKGTEKTIFENAFEKIAPALLQTHSFQEPLERVQGFDYRHFSAYEYDDGKAPEYLHTEYGLPQMEGINLQKLIRGNLRFQDSKSSNGIQAVDLISRGLRRVLRNSFDDCPIVAREIGKLTLQNRKGRLPINLISFAEEASNPNKHSANMLQIIARSSKQMIR